MFFLPFSIFCLIKDELQSFTDVCHHISSAFLLLHCSLHKCSQKREGTCLLDALASENTRLAAKHANTSPPARELAAEPSGSPFGSMDVDQLFLENFAKLWSTDFDSESHEVTPLKNFEVPKRKRTMLCHDMMGGYLAQERTKGVDLPSQQPIYLFMHWWNIDIFNLCLDLLFTPHGHNTPSGLDQRRPLSWSPSPRHFYHRI
ncbi:hypothetical protein L596_018829 [Steinernema carpocapsae]|uniref:Uncharacterized protein n=1 Tax=Steinernema carpocapsae TaxID=34508 RepID=A0A4U5N6I7_STECR|nr:hypothetical protein L596_018829 [Steinernema carpocapsae]